MNCFLILVICVLCVQGAVSGSCVLERRPPPDEDAVETSTYFDVTTPRTPQLGTEYITDPEKLEELLKKYGDKIEWAYNLRLDCMMLYVPVRIRLAIKFVGPGTFTAKVLLQNFDSVKLTLQRFIQLIVLLDVSLSLSLSLSLSFSLSLSLSEDNYIFYYTIASTDCDKTHKEKCKKPYRKFKVTHLSHLRFKLIIGPNPFSDFKLTSILLLKTQVRGMQN